MGMCIKTDVTPNVIRTGENTMRIEFVMEGVELGAVYYEKAKKSFTYKPIGMGSYACVDAKIGELYDKFPQLTPVELMGWCQELIRSV
jgi:hypothetical protein